MQYVVFDRKTGKKVNETFDTLQQAINRACKLNNQINNYNFLVTTIRNK